MTVCAGLCVCVRWCLSLSHICLVVCLRYFYGGVYERYVRLWQQQQQPEQQQQSPCCLSMSGMLLLPPPATTTATATTNGRQHVSLSAGGPKVT